MTGFKPRTSGVGSDRSTNWATTTAQMFCFFVPCTIFSLGIIIFSYLIMNKLALYDPSYLVRKSFPLLGIKHRVTLKSLRLWSGRLDFSALEQPLLGTRVALSRCLLSKLFIEKPPLRYSISSLLLLIMIYYLKCCIWIFLLFANREMSVRFRELV